jgi:hypothetical protein
LIKVTLHLAADNEDDTITDVRDWAEQIGQHGFIDSYGYVFDISEVGVSVFRHGTNGNNDAH